MELSNQVSTRLFVGCEISSEMRMHLNHSIEWKHAALVTASIHKGFQIVCHQGKDYFGFYLEQKKLTVNELKKNQLTIQEQLKIYCLDLETEKIKICIFPQVFIA